MSLLFLTFPLCLHHLTQKAAETGETPTTHHINGPILRHLSCFPCPAVWLSCRPCVLVSCLLAVHAAFIHASVFLSCSFFPSSLVRPCTWTLHHSNCTEPTDRCVRSLHFLLLPVILPSRQMVKVCIVRLPCEFSKKISVQ
jgi:hypothetical protein